MVVDFVLFILSSDSRGNELSLSPNSRKEFYNSCFCTILEIKNHDHSY
jgi:hypothetical protein